MRFQSREVSPQPNDRGVLTPGDGECCHREEDHEGQAGFQFKDDRTLRRGTERTAIRGSGNG